jgi:hypothetical protein
MKRIYRGNYFSFDFEGNQTPFHFRVEVAIDKNSGSWQGDWEILNESGVFHARKFKSKGRIGRFEMRMIE